MKDHLIELNRAIFSLDDNGQDWRKFPYCHHYIKGLFLVENPNRDSANGKRELINYMYEHIINLTNIIPSLEVCELSKSVIYLSLELSAIVTEEDLQNIIIPIGQHLNPNKLDNISPDLVRKFMSTLKYIKNSLSDTNDKFSEVAKNPIRSLAESTNIPVEISEYIVSFVVDLPTSDITSINSSLSKNEIKPENYCDKKDKKYLDRYI